MQLRRRALRSFSPRHQRAAPFDDGEENSLRTAHFCAPCAQKCTLARHQPSGLARLVPLGRGSRREYFTTYTPRNMNFDFIRGLRAANSVRLNNSGRTPCYSYSIASPNFWNCFFLWRRTIFLPSPQNGGRGLSFFCQFERCSGIFYISS